MTTIATPRHDLGVAGQIALLALEHENAREEANRTERDLAREARREAAADEYEALVDSADALETGALVSGSITLISGGLTSAGGTMAIDAECKADRDLAALYSSSGSVVGAFAGPADALIGQSRSQRARADAENAAFAGEQAAWRASDADDELAKADRNRDRVLAAVESVNEAERAATNAVVGNI